MKNVLPVREIDPRPKTGPGPSLRRGIVYLLANGGLSVVMPCNQSPSIGTKACNSSVSLFGYMVYGKQ